MSYNFRYMAYIKRNMAYIFRFRAYINRNLPNCERILPKSLEQKYSASKEVVDAVNEFKEYIMDEVLALTLEESNKAETEFKINDYDMKVSIKQVK